MACHYKISGRELLYIKYILRHIYLYDLKFVFVPVKINKSMIMRRLLARQRFNQATIHLNQVLEAVGESLR